MAKIESIRPGGTLDASFGTYPLAELLIGILRGNLSGRLDVFLHPEPKNHVLFRNGVPIVVELPDSGASLVQVLIEAGSLPKERGLDLLRLAEASGRSQIALVEEKNLLSRGALHEAKHRLARRQVVRLFDAGPADFRFTEGVMPDEGVVITILQTLPIVYEGLVRTSDRDIVDRFVASHGTDVFALSATYPHGVDPFEWGSDVEAAITPDDETVTIDLLVQRGLARETAGAAIMSAYLAGMMEVKRRGAAAAPEPRRDQRVEDPRLVEARRAARQSTDAPAQKDPSGLVIHRRSQGGAVKVQQARTEAPAAPLQGRLVAPPPPPTQTPADAARSAHDAEYTSVRDRLTPYRNQNYFQLLRVTPGTDAAQLERSYRFLLRRIEEEGEDAGTLVIRELLNDAMDVLGDPDRSKRYAALVEQAEKNPSADRERLAFEAEPKVERAFRAMAIDMTGIATYLLSWAEKQDSSRTDVPILFAMVDYLRSPPAQRGTDARALEAMIEDELMERGHDWRVRLCYGLLLAERNDVNGAKRNIESAPDETHPMVVRIKRLVGS